MGCLIPKKLLKNIPKLYETENEEDPLCCIKLFAPDSNFTWYIIEISIDEDLCYGYVQSLESELGYFSLEEIQDIRGSLNLPVEIDSSFKPTLLSSIKADL
jgi:hypothetical protein